MDNRGSDAQQYQAPGDRQPQQHPLVKKIKILSRTFV